MTIRSSAPLSDKTEAAFARLIAGHAVRPHEAIMAVNAMRSDILPALAAEA